MTAHGISKNNGRARVFISYKRNSDPDERLALQVYESLNQLHDVFIDQSMGVGTRWAEQIETELRRSDFLITFLSAHSVLSEMVQGEIETAYRLSKEHGRPYILPVRVGYREPFNYPLSAYLNPINWAFWSEPGDTSRLIDELTRAMTGGQLAIGDSSKDDLIVVGAAESIPQPLPLAQPLQLNAPEGAMDPQSDFYMKRQSDEIALSAIKRQGVTIVIKGPRQMGKSSLLIRTIAEASEAGKRVAFLDFQLVDKATLTNADLFFRQFCCWLTDELDLDDRVDQYWSSPLGNSQRCTRYLSKYVLKELNCPLVLAMDEVDCVFGTDFRSDFFGMLRNWHNQRATVTLPVWKQLDLVLVTSTEPYQLIDNLNQSPFNVGEVLELADFDPDQVTELNSRHGSPFNQGDKKKLMALLAGHPYLVRRALYLVANDRLSVSELFACATDDRGPFGDHLRYHLFRMNDKEELIDGLRQIIRSGTCQNDHTFFRLRGAGLVRKDGRKVVPRCLLYEDYFREHLHV
jgi:AAA-like domain/TIR domain